ncbi:hypothetical protein NOS3756_55970 (plasmid) [Nostoc sp. NIES-3756]|uniref:hypothetical protein n=1 Tax=Nostoc sp. NIES-3756 TaxID=1751286 RepID=UPI00072024ED|nr:hypothetical protein [Nostoc sp. NIES-3756]BAT56585.1 hypothetical protein NOS3756_55970 [Nostoc sp. NIES-3756]
MKITSYEQLNKLVAESLGWQTGVELIEQGKFQAEVEFYYPVDIEEDRRERWFDEFGIAPDFANELWNVEAFLIPECDRQRLVTQITITPTMVSCGIKPLIADERNTGMAVTGEKGIPKSIALAVCLAWLRFKGVEFELQLPAEEGL